MAKAYTLIQAQTLTSSAASVTFSNIPQNYTDLIVKMSTRSAAAGSGSDFAMGMRINGVETDRTYRRLEAYNGTTVASDSGSTDFSAIIQGNTSTESTFNNVDIYFTNYTSSSHKSFSVDGANENNSNTGNDLYFFAGLWSQTAAITSLGFYDKGTSSNFLANSTFYLYGVGGTRATGGTITSDFNYTYHTFTSTSAFTPLEKIKNAEILLVAGGGGAGGAHGGGGGAGGVISYRSQTFLAGTSYTAVVGAGGVGSSSSAAGTNGGISSLGSLAAIGGGGGGTYAGTTTSAGSSGGSGGGGSNYPNNTVYSGGTGTSGQGHAGGNSSGNNAGGGGGGGGGSSPTGPGAGGSSAIGYDGVNYGTITQGGGTGGFGGAGTSVYHSWHVVTSTGVSSNNTYYIAGGGAGGSYVSPTSGTDRGAVASLGGIGGGGYGGRSTATGNYTPVAGSAGTTNSGSGGGGGAGNGGSGSAGGSGLIIVRYPSN